MDTATVKGMARKVSKEVGIVLALAVAAVLGFLYHQPQSSPPTLIQPVSAQSPAPQTPPSPPNQGELRQERGEAHSEGQAPQQALPRAPAEPADRGLYIPPPPVSHWIIGLEQMPTEPLPLKQPYSPGELRMPDHKRLSPIPAERPGEAPEAPSGRPQPKRAQPRNGYEREAPREEQAPRRRREAPRDDRERERDENKNMSVT